jgi:hypothetical protein
MTETHHKGVQELIQKIQEATDVLSGLKEQAIRIRPAINQQPMLAEEKKLLETVEMNRTITGVISKLLCLKEQTR